MIAANGTISRIGKKQPSAKQSEGETKPKGGRTKVGFFVELPPALLEALEAYLATLRPKVLKTNLTQTLFEDFLTKQGFWPWPRPVDQSATDDHSRVED